MKRPGPPGTPDTNQPPETYPRVIPFEYPGPVIGGSGMSSIEDLFRRQLGMRVPIQPDWYFIPLEGPGGGEE